MARARAYLDFNASAPLLHEARAAMVDALALNGNASSVHAEGRAIRRLIEEARRDVAALCNARADHVVFTSGATEAASWLLTPDWRMGRSPLRMSKLYVGATEHPCVSNGGRFSPADIEIVPVQKNGLLDLAALASMLDKHDRDAGLALVALQYANNETGVVQPVSRIAGIVRAAGGVLIVDAVQAAGRISLDITEGCGDFLILSAHKIGGPKGAGAVVAQSDLMMPAPLVRGGGQEKGHRAGTENAAALAGFGAAARAASEVLSRSQEISALRDETEDRILDIVPGATIFGREAPRLNNTSFFAIPGVKAETAQIAFDLAGVAVSAGSACSSGRVGPSHVLKAMGHGDDASAIRLSIGASTTRDELDCFLEALASLVARANDAERAA